VLCVSDPQQYAEGVGKIAPSKLRQLVQTEISCGGSNPPIKTLAVQTPVESELGCPNCCVTDVRTMRSTWPSHQLTRQYKSRSVSVFTRLAMAILSVRLSVRHDRVRNQGHVR